jgi:hypothetical protein
MFQQPEVFFDELDQLGLIALAGYGLESPVPRTDSRH